MKYQVEFAGIAHVEAESSEEAKVKAENDDIVYSEIEWIVAEEVDRFEVHI